MRPGSPATVILTLANVRWRPLFVNTSETVVAVGGIGIVNGLCGPNSGTGLSASVTVGETGQPFGTSTDHDRVVLNERSVSRLKEGGDAVNWPVMSAMQSGGGGGPSEPPEGSAWEGFVQTSVIARAIVRSETSRETTGARRV